MIRRLVLQAAHVIVVWYVIFKFLLPWHGDEIWKSYVLLGVFFALVAAIQYSARALGYLYLLQRARVVQSRRWTNFLQLLGVEPWWHTSKVPNAQIVADVGDSLFVGLWKFLMCYLLAALAILIGFVQVFAALRLDLHKVSTVKVVYLTSALVPGLAAFLWISRRDNNRPKPRRGPAWAYTAGGAVATLFLHGFVFGFLRMQPPQTGLLSVALIGAALGWFAYLIWSRPRQPRRPPGYVP